MKKYLCYESKNKYFAVQIQHRLLKGIESLEQNQIFKPQHL